MGYYNPHKFHWNSCIDLCYRDLNNHDIYNQNLSTDWKDKDSKDYPHKFHWNSNIGLCYMDLNNNGIYNQNLKTDWKNKWDNRDRLHLNLNIDLIHKN